MNLTGRLNGLNELTKPLAVFWAARNPRERTLLAVAMIVIAVGLVYLLLIDPALAGRKQLNKSLPVLRQQVAEIQAMAKEAGSLPQKGATAVAPVSKESVETALTRTGLKPQNVTLIAGENVRVQLASVPFAGIIDWLSEMQKTALLSVTEANVTALPEAGLVNATLLLRQRKSE